MRMPPRPAAAIRLHARIVLFLSFVLATSGPASHAATLLDVDRFVLTSSFIDSYQIFSDDDADGVASSDSGFFLEAAVAGVGLGDLVNARGEATQDSEVAFKGGGIRVEAGGGAGGLFDVAEPGYPSRAQSHSDTQISIIFSVDTPTAYVLSASLFAELVQLDQFSGSGPLEADIFASARLFGLASGVLYEREARDASVDDIAVTLSLTQTGVLAPDIYVLDLYASSFLRGFEDAAGLGSASFGVSFTVVPEPGTSALIGLGLVGLAGRRTRTTPVYGDIRLFNPCSDDNPSGDQLLDPSGARTNS